MHSNCILDSVVDLLVRHMVLVGNVQKSLIASHLKGLDPSLDNCCQYPGVDFTKGFKRWYKFSTEIHFMLIPIIVLFTAHEFITGKF